MSTFREILTATDTDLVKIFYKVSASPSNDFIKQINKVAKGLSLNHAQLVCATGFNSTIPGLPDIISILGFQSYKLLIYRRNELYTTDTYQQLDISNVLDIYAEQTHAEDLDDLRKLLHSRLKNVEADIRKNADPHHTISYRMEIQSLYHTAIADKAFAEERLKQPGISKCRQISSEAKAIIDANLCPPSNIFFMNELAPEEKRFLIENEYIDRNMLKNRLQNNTISQDEREMLEEFIYKFHSGKTVLPS